MEQALEREPHRFLLSVCQNAFLSITCMLQEQGYMAARGSVTGIITTLENTWMVESDRAGNLQITEPVHCSTKGSPTEVSAMEVSLKLARPQQMLHDTGHAQAHQPSVYCCLS